MMIYFPTPLLNYIRRILDVLLLDTDFAIHIKIH